MIQEQKRNYEEVLNDLSNCLNNGQRKENTTELFYSCVQELFNNYGQEITTKFLRGLIENKTNRQKALRIFYLLRQSGLTTEKKNRYFESWGSHLRKAEVTEYKQGKKGVLIKDNRVVQVGDYFKSYLKEVVYFIKGF